jgi:hypothetical protein
MNAPRHYWDIPPTLPSGAWAAKRALAAKLRELAEIVVTTDAPEEDLAMAGEAADDLKRVLASHPRRTFKDGFLSCKDPTDFAVFADRTALTGESNPISPPMRLVKEGINATGLVTFGPSYEGIPGCVHGGFVAAAFDQVFGYLQVINNRGGVTATLEVRYRRPTPMNVELRIESTTTEVSGKRSLVAAKMYANGVVTAEATGTFVEIDPVRMKAIAEAKSPEER